MVCNAEGEHAWGVININHKVALLKLPYRYIHRGNHKRPQINLNVLQQYTLTSNRQREC